MMIVVSGAIKHYGCFLLFSLWYLGVIASGISVNKLCSPNPIKFDVSSHSVLNCPGTGPPARIPSLQLLHSDHVDTSRAVPGQMCSGREDAVKNWEPAPTAKRAALAGSEVREKVGLCQQPQDPCKDSKILKPLMCSLVSGFNPKSFSGWLPHSGSEGRGLYWGKVCNVIFPIQKVWLHVIYGFFPGARSLPHQFCSLHMSACVTNNVPLFCDSIVLQQYRL